MGKLVPVCEHDWSRYEPGLRRYFRRRMPSAAVDDLLQEVWVRLCSLQDPSKIENIERYLFVVASSVISRHRRWQSDEEGIDAGIIDEYLREDLAPDRYLMGKQRMALVVDVLDQLPARTQQVFLLHRFEEKTYRRIAQDLGISVSAVEKHMMKALKALVSSDAATE